MHGIVIFMGDDHYRPMIAMWTHDLCMYFYRPFDGENRRSKHLAMVFKGLSIHIHVASQSTTGGEGPIRETKIPVQ